MKFNTLKREYFTVDVWDMTPFGDPPILTYNLSKTKVGMKCGVGPNAFNSTQLFLITDAPIAVGSQVRNVRDRAGTAMGADVRLTPYTVVTNEPMINLFGFIEGYKVTCN